LIAALPDDPDPCPGFRLGEWHRVRANALAILAAHEYAAISLGWSAPDLLGVHPIVGVARLDYCGALLLGFGPVKLVTAEAIVYANDLVYRRCPTPADAVPVWAYRRNEETADAK
jgi:hypothetical protein